MRMVMADVEFQPVRMRRILSFLWAGLPMAHPLSLNVSTALKRTIFCYTYKNIGGSEFWKYVGIDYITDQSYIIK